jgi:hypothetical protein
MPVDFRVLNWWTATRPPIEKGQIKTPGEPHEQEQGKEPEHQRFELERHPMGNISGCPSDAI